MSEVIYPKSTTSEIIYPKCATMLDFLDDAIERVTKLERETDKNDVKKEIVVLKFVIEAYEAKLKYYNTPDAIILRSKSVCKWCKRRNVDERRSEL